MITVALPKGRLQKPLLALLGDDGPHPDDLASRRLVYERGGVRFIPLKDPDVPTWVERGACDVGIVGADVLGEHPSDVLEPVDLGFGRCTVALAGLPGLDLRGLHAKGALRVATKYPRTTARALAARGLVADIIEQSGSVEVAVLAGLADAIVDLVETGRTLRENGLVVHETLATVTARVVVNRASWRLAHREVGAFVTMLRARALEAGHAAA